MQVMPPSPNPPPPLPPPPLYDSYGPVSIVHAMPGPPPPEMMLPGQTMVPVIGTLQPGPGPLGSVMSPPIQLHYSQLMPADQVYFTFVFTHLHPENSDIAPIIRANLQEKQECRCSDS